MTVLIAVASRHGATQQIAEVIGETVHGNGFAVDVVKLTRPDESGSRPDPTDYEAVVLGSAVYLGRWLAPARDFVRRHRPALDAMPVWAFSSGPLGDIGGAPSEPAVAAPVAGFRPMEHRLFGGRLDRQQLGLMERALVRVVRAGDEDDRDWEEIASWATAIADTLRHRPVVIPPGPAATAPRRRDR